MQTEYFQLKVLPVRNKLFRYACTIVRSREEAEDIVQDVMMKLWIKKDELEKIKNLEAWSITMIRNLAYDRFRKSNRENVVAIDRDMNNIPHESDSDTGHAEERLSHIYRYIRDLPERQHHVVFLRDIEGHTYKEIGAIMGMDENLVKVTLFRARENLRKKILKIENYGL